MHLAAAGNDLVLMEKALAWGCAINAEQNNGANALNTAAVAGHHTAVDFLLKQGASVRNEGPAGSPLHSAAAGYQVNMLALEEHKTNATPAGLQPFFGTPADFTATVTLLLSNGLSVNEVNTRGSAPLHLAASAPVALVRVLLDAGADMERRDKDNFTPLLRAAQGGSVRNVELLLDRGADVKVVSTRRFNALFWAAHLGQAEVVSLLLQRGFDAKARDGNQATPLHWAALYGSESTARALLDGGAEINARDLAGQTPLHQAVTARRLAMVRMLLARGASTELRETGQGHRPADAARRFGFYDVADAIDAHARRLNGQ